MLRFDGIRVERDGFALTADCTVEAPGIVAIIGPSGGGKSTLLSVIAGFEMPDQGQVFWRGRDIGPEPPGNRPVAILFQDNNLFPHLDILTNVALGASARVHPSQEAMERAHGALSRVDLAGFEGRKPGELSGGQQSRAALARVLLTDRPVVLMDEAFSALGPALRAEMLSLVRELLPETLILMVTHDPEDAKRWADRTIFVEGGTVHPPQATIELFANPPSGLRQYLE